ncbi:MAG: hypothetical protein H6918_11370 [Sphingomonadaceae bacterium]|nr:hypothetical protein [Sphingomonadaceae bacterium]
MNAESAVQRAEETSAALRESAEAATVNAEIAGGGRLPMQAALRDA